VGYFNQQNISTVHSHANENSRRKESVPHDKDLRTRHESPWALQLDVSLSSKGTPRFMRTTQEERREGLRNCLNHHRQMGDVAITFMQIAAMSLAAVHQFIR